MSDVYGTLKQQYDELWEENVKLEAELDKKNKELNVLKLELERQEYLISELLWETSSLRGRLYDH